MSVMRGAVGLVGVLLALMTLVDVVTAMLVPRGGSVPIARAVSFLVFRPYRLAVRLSSSFPRQDRILASAAPVALLAQLIAYVTILIVALGLVVYALSPLDLTTALYQSASTLTTLGIVAPVTGASAIACFVAAFLGLVVIAIFIGYLMALYAAYTPRESLMARWSLVAGEPAWAPAVFARATLLGIPPADVVDAERWTDWACDLRTNIAVSPVLAYIRSSTPLRHWSTTLLSVLDTAALRAACRVTETHAVDVSLIAEGIVSARVVSGQRGDVNFRVEEAILEALAGRTTGADAGISDAQWQACLPVLRASGLVTDANAEDVRSRFLAVRALYWREVSGLTRTFHAVPAPWSGERAPAVAALSPRMTALGSHGGGA
jgi:hypothetical protein